MSNLVLVPYRGIYFLYLNLGFADKSFRTRFSSPIGESIFSTEERKFNESVRKCSRPLSGNLFSLLKVILV